MSIIPPRAERGFLGEDITTKALGGAKDSDGTSPIDLTLAKDVARQATGIARPSFSAPGVNRLFLLLAIVTLGLAGITVIVYATPSLHVVVAPSLDLALNTTAVVVAAGLAVLSWIGFREGQEPDSLYQASAFLVLFLGGALMLVLQLSGSDAAAGLSRASPGQAPLYIWTLQRLFAAVLLLLGALVALNTSAAPGFRRAALIAVMPGAVLLAMAFACIVLQSRLPMLIAGDRLAAIIQPGSEISGVALDPLALLQVAVAALYLAAAATYAASHVRKPASGPYTPYLAVGLIVAAFSQLHFAIVPGVYTGLMTSGDILRLGFYSIVGVGIAAAARHDLKRLREANRTLHRIRAADTRRITLEERERLAREIHDGLVQELWLARLTHGRMKLIDAMPSEATEIVDRVDIALENSLAEARQAIVALQTHEEAGFGILLQRVVEDYADRFGLDVECTIDGDIPAVAGEKQAELLRICREAMNNARKHADATLVRVRLERTEDALRMSVTDNGAGFDTSQPSGTGFGLQGMRERAGVIGGRLDIQSAPMDGTRVILELPLTRTR